MEVEGSIMAIWTSRVDDYIGWGSEWLRESRYILEMTSAAVHVQSEGRGR